MKSTIAIELEVGDEIRLYDERGNRGRASVLAAGPYEAVLDRQWLRVQTIGAYKGNSAAYACYGRIENKASALGYDCIPVLALEFL